MLTPRCHGCPLSEPDGPHRRKCSVSGRNIADHFAKGDCPKGHLQDIDAPAEEAVPHVAGIPMAGDLLKEAMAKVGADRLSKWWEKVTGKPCGCAERQAKINRAHAALKRWLTR